MILTEQTLASLSDHDRAEIEKFSLYLRRVVQAVDAGVTSKEAQVALYADSYPDDDASRGDPNP
jgi:hypothetical protein